MAKAMAPFLSLALNPPVFPPLRVGRPSFGDVRPLRKSDSDEMRCRHDAKSGISPVDDAAAEAHRDQVKQLLAVIEKYRLGERA